MNITVATGKAGKQAVFTIEFKASDFLQVVDAVAEIKTIDQVLNSKLWTVK